MMVDGVVEPSQLHHLLLVYAGEAATMWTHWTANRPTHHCSLGSSMQGDEIQKGILSLKLPRPRYHCVEDHRSNLDCMAYCLNDPIENTSSFNFKRSPMEEALVDNTGSNRSAP